MRALLPLLLVVGCTRITEDELAWRSGLPGVGDDTGCADELISWLDQDGDGYGDLEAPEAPCTSTKAGVDNNLDCDDSDASVHPDMVESCSTEADDDCDGSTNSEDAIDCIPFYLDQDGDGWGLDEEICACDAIDEYGAENLGDCNDEVAAINPGVEEVCSNGIDDDCDGGPSDCELSGDLDADEAWLVVLGASSGDVFGTAVSGGGDLTGNGLGNLVVTAISGDLGGSNSGHVYILPGDTSGTFDLSAQTTSVLIGSAADDRLGWSVAGVEDTNSDGFSEILVGALYESTGDYHAGGAYLVFGPMDGELQVEDVGVLYTGEVEDDRAGCAVDSAGDVNGDGEIDLLIGAYRESSVGSAAGAAYLVYGPHLSSSSLADAGVKFLGDGASDRAGFSVAGPGDLNGDGLDDVVIGADREDTGGSNAGMVYVVLGDPGGDMGLMDADGLYHGVEGQQSAGFSLAGAGDVNGDGLQDLIIGGPGQDADYEQRGAAWVVYGPATSESPLVDAEGQLQGLHPADRFGHSVSGAGDVDGDGLDDIWIGAPEMGTNPTAPTGSTTLFYGPVSGGFLSDDSEFTVWGNETDDELGQDVAGVGDVNGDSRPDLLIGVSDSDENGSLAGSALLIPGVGL